MENNQQDLEKRLRDRVTYLEMMAAAYFNTTEIEPSNAVLCEMRIANGTTLFFFDSKDRLTAELKAAAGAQEETQLTN